MNQLQTQTQYEINSNISNDSYVVPAGFSTPLESSRSESFVHHPEQVELSATTQVHHPEQVELSAATQVHHPEQVELSAATQVHHPEQVELSAATQVHHPEQVELSAATQVHHPEQVEVSAATTQMPGDDHRPHQLVRAIGTFILGEPEEVPTIKIEVLTVYAKNNNTDCTCMYS